MDAGADETLDDVAIVIADRRGRIELWSHGATALFGHEAETMLGTPITRLVPPGLRSRHAAGWREAWRRGTFEAGAAVLIPVVCADGEIRHFASRIEPITDAHGTMVAVLATWSAPSALDTELRAIDHR